MKGIDVNVSAQARDRAAQNWDFELVERPVARSISATALRLFLTWTVVFWGGVGVCAVLFFAGVVDFASSAKISLYGISIWLNGWLLAFVARRRESRSRLDLYHDCLALWMLSYAMTNALWEVPWVILSPFVFENLHTLDDVLAYTGYMRESVFNMYWWVLASFSSVDLRTVNHDSTFYTLEIYSFVNVLSVLYFFHLNKRRSPYRYLVPVLGSGEPIASTFIFSFSEVFGGFENMTGGLADTLLALLWTQYQYFFFPMIFGYLGFQLLREDWRQCHSGEVATSPSGSRRDDATARGSGHAFANKRL